MLKQSNVLLQIGVAPGKSFDLENMDSSTSQQIVGGARDALVRIFANARKSHGKNIGGWEFMMNVGRYGTDYLWRAVVA